MQQKVAKSRKVKARSHLTKAGYGGAETNLRIIEIRQKLGLTRSELARITGYSRSFIDNWLNIKDSPNWREAPEPAVRLLELELGLRKPSYLELPGRT